MKQAKKLAQRLKDEKFDHIYSSDLSRAADTAKIIAKYHPDVPLDFVLELREMGMGNKTGTVGNKDDNKNLFNLAPDAESFKSMQSRTKKLIELAYSKHPNGSVLFVGHGQINKAILSVIENKPASSIPDHNVMSNTAISIFEVREDKKHVIHLLNCTKHLG